MSLITSKVVTEGVRMSEQIAERDITEVNEAGQTVVVVPKGRPIPEHLVKKPAKAAGKKVAGPAENKARRAPKSSK